MHEVPFADAPGLFARLHDALGEHHYAWKQPETVDKHEHMFATIRHADAACTAVDDRSIQKHRIQAAEGPICIGLLDDFQRNSSRFWSGNGNGRRPDCGAGCD